MKMTKRLTSIGLLPFIMIGTMGCGSDEPNTPLVFPTPGADGFGSWEVGYRHSSAIDRLRSRELPIDIWYPVDSEDAVGERARYLLLPPLGPDAEIAFDAPHVSDETNRKLIVFSHGSNSISLQSTLLMEMLASHGFIVVAPEHLGNSQSSSGDSFDVSSVNRVEDVSFIIDYFLAGADNAADFSNKIDPLMVGVAGHSFGGHTTMGTAVGWNGAMADDRVKAIAPISGTLSNYSESELAMLDIPVFLLGGTLDDAVPVSNNDYARQQTTSTVYQTDIIGATHTQFANVCAIGDWLIDNLNISSESWTTIGASALVEPYEESCLGLGVINDEETLRLQNTFLVSFFNKHLQNMPEYSVYLTHEYAKTEASVNFCTHSDSNPCTPLP